MYNFGGHMLHSEHDMKKWKKEQINYFKKYLGAFREGTKEFSLLKKGIEELEGTM